MKRIISLSLLIICILPLAGAQDVKYYWVNDDSTTILQTINSKKQIDFHKGDLLTATKDTIYWGSDKIPFKNKTNNQTNVKEFKQNINFDSIIFFYTNDSLVIYNLLQRDTIYYGVYNYHNNKVDTLLPSSHKILKIDSLAKREYLFVKHKQEITRNPAKPKENVNYTETGTVTSFKRIKDLDPLFNNTDSILMKVNKLDTAYYYPNDTTRISVHKEYLGANNVWWFSHNETETRFSPKEIKNITIYRNNFLWVIIGILFILLITVALLFTWKRRAKTNSPIKFLGITTVTTTQEKVVILRLEVAYNDAFKEELEEITQNIIHSSPDSKGIDVSCEAGCAIISIKLEKCSASDEKALKQLIKNRCDRKNIFDQISTNEKDTYLPPEGIISKLEEFNRKCSMENSKTKLAVKKTDNPVSEASEEKKDKILAQKGKDIADLKEKVKDVEKRKEEERKNAIKELEEKKDKIIAQKEKDIEDLKNKVIDVEKRKEEERKNAIKELEEKKDKIIILKEKDIADLKNKVIDVEKRKEEERKSAIKELEEKRDKIIYLKEKDIADLKNKVIDVEKRKEEERKNAIKELEEKKDKVIYLKERDIADLKNKVIDVEKRKEEEKLLAVQNEINKSEKYRSNLSFVDYLTPFSKEVVKFFDKGEKLMEQVVNMREKALAEERTKRVELLDKALAKYSTINYGADLGRWKEQLNYIINNSGAVIANSKTDSFIRQLINEQKSDSQQEIIFQFERGLSVSVLKKYCSSILVLIEDICSFEKYDTLSDKERKYFKEERVDFRYIIRKQFNLEINDIAIFESAYNKPGFDFNKRIPNTFGLERDCVVEILAYGVYRSDEKIARTIINVC